MALAPVPAQLILVGRSDGSACACADVAFFVSRLFQIRTNTQRGGTGQLQVITRAALFLGNLMRISTTITKGGGFPMLIGHASSGLANGTIFFQCLWYWNSKTSL
jgi:hypothetical protein